jgi:hypothetical protein
VSEQRRAQVRDRANRRCEYCQKLEQVSTYGFHVDHIIPIAHGGNSEMENLAWACFECNVSKGRDISSYDPITGELTPLFNPRRQNWADHFALDKWVIVGKTAVGRVTISILLLNHPDQIMTRRQLIEAGVW